MSTQPGADSPLEFGDFDVPTQLTCHPLSAELSTDFSFRQIRSQLGAVEKHALTRQPTDIGFRGTEIQFSVRVTSQLQDVITQEDLNSATPSKADTSCGKCEERSASRTFTDSGLADVASAIILRRRKFPLSTDSGEDANKVSLCLRPKFVRELAAIRSRAESASMTQVEDAAREASLLWSCRRGELCDQRNAGSCTSGIAAVASDAASLDVDRAHGCALGNTDASDTVVASEVDSSMSAFLNASTQSRDWKWRRNSQDAHQNPKGSWSAVPPVTVGRDWISHLPSPSENECDLLNIRTAGEANSDGCSTDSHSKDCSKVAPAWLTLGSWHSVYREEFPPREWKQCLVTITPEEHGQALEQPSSGDVSAEQTSQRKKNPPFAATTSAGCREVSTEMKCLQNEGANDDRNSPGSRDASGRSLMSGAGRKGPVSRNHPSCENSEYRELSPQTVHKHVNSQPAPVVSATEQTRHHTEDSFRNLTRDVTTVQNQKGHLEAEVFEGATESGSSEAEVVTAYSILSSLRSVHSDSLPSRLPPGTESGKHVANRDSCEAVTGGGRDVAGLASASHSQSVCTEQLEALETSSVVATDAQGKRTGTESSFRVSETAWHSDADTVVPDGSKSPYAAFKMSAASRRTPKKSKERRLSKSPLNGRSAGLATPSARTARRSAGRSRTKTIEQVYSPLVYAPLDPASTPVTPRKRTHSRSPTITILRQRGCHPRLGQSSAECRVLNRQYSQGDFASRHGAFRGQGFMDLSAVKCEGNELTEHEQV